MFFARASPAQQMLHKQFAFRDLNNFSSAQQTQRPAGFTRLQGARKKGVYGLPNKIYAISMRLFENLLLKTRMDTAYCLLQSTLFKLPASTQDSQLTRFINRFGA
jgi:hypothetical protein